MVKCAIYHLRNCLYSLNCEIIRVLNVQHFKCLISYTRIIKFWCFWGFRRYMAGVWGPAGPGLLSNTPYTGVGARPHIRVFSNINFKNVNLNLANGWFSRSRDASTFQETYGTYSSGNVRTLIPWVHHSKILWWYHHGHVFLLYWKNYYTVLCTSIYDRRLIVRVTVSME